MIEVEPSVDSRHECADTLIRVGEDLLRVSIEQDRELLIGVQRSAVPSGRLPSTVGSSCKESVVSCNGEGGGVRSVVGGVADVDGVLAPAWSRSAWVQ